MSTGPAGRARGFTLPDALLAIVVIGIALAGVLMAFSTIARSSADPVVRRQMLAIAEERLEQIEARSYAVAANPAAAGCGRETFNDVAGCNGCTSSGRCSVDGLVTPALSTYAVSIEVASATLSGVVAARRITVIVSHGGVSLQLAGWRTDFAS